MSVKRQALFQKVQLVAAVATIALLSASTHAQVPLRVRMLIAEDQRATSDTDLASADAQLRRQAVRAIGRLERPPLLPLITPLLADNVVGVRAEAANAVGQIGTKADGLQSARTALLARAKSETVPTVLGVLAATLGRLAYSTAAEVQESERAIAASMTANLDQTAGAVEGFEALLRQSGKLSSPSGDTLARLRTAATLRRGGQEGDLAARIRRLARLALNTATAIDREILASGVSDPDEEVRRLTMLAARAPLDSREEIITAGLKDTSPRVRYEALQSWGRTMQKTSCAPILQALRDQNAHVSLLAIDLLGAACPDQAAATAAVRSLAEVLTTRPGAWHTPAHAIVSLARVAPDEARKMMPRYASHPIWQVRMYAAHAAARAQAPDTLVQLARDTHDNVREAALGELATLKHPQTATLALEALQRPDYQLIITAARALDLPDAKDRAVPALVSALKRITAERRDNSRDARRAILDRLDAFGWRDADAARENPSPRPAFTAADIIALDNTRLRFTMSGKGAFELRLLTDEAPLTVLRLVTRAREGYYNGLTFHRVVPNFVIQGGSPGANEYVGDAAFMRDEVGLISHRRGTVGISTRGRDTGDAQIFVNLVDLPRLDHTYTVCAEVLSGMDIVDAILEGDVIERVEVIRSGAR
jgi:cyclophilin family peptidyl-prolyl cis-trans isomerase/HEAT repeat protein